MRVKIKVGIRYTRGDKIFLTIDWILLVIFFVIILYPLLFIFVSSISAGTSYMRLSLVPKKFSLEGYKAVFEHAAVWIGYRNSLIYTVSYTLISMFITICCAYPLSRKDFGTRKILMALCLFTMYFNGGLIPTYIWMRQLKLINTVWALLLPNSLSIYNMIVMRTYFSTQIPEELHEASMLDGCSDMRYLVNVIIPLSGPILAVIALYYAVGMWNDYFNAMIYISDRSLLPLQNILREILMVNVQHNTSTSPLTQQQIEDIAKMEQRAELMKYSLIVVSSVPVMILYPFVQKYFVKGVMIGAVKG
ncbi:MAG: carbohydrate ABC transporter permease [Christensenellaceae bacterium]|nr:carbohydrate ABC transporter permease [Christensenellaceae bacterium]